MMNYKKTSKETSYKLRLSLISISLFAALSSAAHGSGFQLLEQNASGLSTAFAGSGVNTENASVLYFNPAGMSYLPGLNISGGLVTIKPTFKFRNDGHSSPPLAFRGNAPLGLDGLNGGKWGIIPNAFLSWQINDRFTTGIGFSVPFGLMTKFNDDWIGRFHSRKFSIQVININPSIAYKINKKWSIGAGLNWQRIDAEYRVAQILPASSSVMLTANAKARVHNDTLGWNVGVIYQPIESTRIGLSYRSKMRHKAKGTTYLDIGGSPIMNLFARANVVLPDTFILSASHQLTEDWKILGDISWTGWSSIEQLTIKNKGIMNSTKNLDLRFRDTWRVALGAHYRINERWKWKVGIAYDQSPIRNAEYRAASLPDNARLWFSTGVQFKPTADTSIDLSYGYMHLNKTRINNNNRNQLEQGLISGDFKNHGHVIGIQVSKHF